MRKDVKDALVMVALAVALLAFGLLASYGSARLGHPTAVWLWRDMLGVLQ